MVKLSRPLISSLYTAFNFSVLSPCFDAFPIVFEGVYGFNRGLSGLIILGIRLECCIYLKSLSEGRRGAVAPEHGLYVTMMGSLGIPIGLLWNAWTASKDVVLATIPFAWRNGLLKYVSGVAFPLLLHRLISLTPGLADG